jgi:O-antigen ligase
MTVRRRLQLAVALSFILHAALVLTARYRASYDAYTHMFFADHYLHHWGTLWEPRWYAGFSVASYPPLAHQVMALFATVVGVDAAFGLLLLLVATMLPLAAYAFARVFCTPAMAATAALGAAVLPAIYMAAYTFGQLPTLMAALFALFAFAALARYLRTGERISAALTVALVAVVAATHHATLLLLPPGGLAIAAHLLINRQVTPQALVRRLLAAAPLSALAALLVIWPFWRWGAGQAMQTPIDHLSRHDFLSDGTAWLMFFLPMYGLLTLLLPLALRGLFRRATLAPAALFLGLFTLGLGGTTPLPRWLFGAGWAWLTYDRFALWASLVLLIFCGEAAVLVQCWMQKAWLAIRMRTRHTLRGALAATGRAFLLQKTDAWGMRVGWALRAGGWGILSACSLLAGLFPLWYPTQPPVIDMQPIVAFLSQADRSQWRYVTLGFGDQYAQLSLLTTATTIDGSYHTARSLPELRQSGIGQIDSAFWMDKGVDALNPILAAAGQHGVRWAFVARDDYIGVLLRHGWRPKALLPNAVEVWENAKAVLPAPQPAPADDPLQAFSYSVFPLVSLALAGVLALGLRWRAATAAWLLRLHALAVGLLPISLGFWYFNPLVMLDRPRVYLTYTDALLFVSDALILVAVVAWGLARWLAPGQPVLRGAGPRPWPLRVLTYGLLAWCVLATCSAVWAIDPLVTLTLSAHLWLLFAFYLSLLDSPVDWRVVAAGASAALLVQAGIGMAEFALQSTAFLDGLGMKWPGTLAPAMHGASVVQLADGTRWLRAYGSLPHPNILGGLVSVWLAGPAAAWLLARRRWRLAAALIVVVGMALLSLTFSRAALLGCAAAGGVLAWHYRQLGWRRLVGLALAALLGVLIVAAPMGRLLLTRVSGSQAGVITEMESIRVREWMTQQAVRMISAHPLLGVGLGNYTLALDEQAPGDFPLEPVHNVALLALSELGLPGALLLAALLIAFAVGALRARHPLAILASAMGAALLVAALFDHYLWTVAPGRDLLWWVLGLWAGWSTLAGPSAQIWFTPQV